MVPQWVTDLTRLCLLNTLSSKFRAPTLNLTREPDLRGARRITGINIIIFVVNLSLTNKAGSLTMRQINQALLRLSNGHLIRLIKRSMTTTGLARIALFDRGRFSLSSMTTNS